MTLHKFTKIFKTCPESLIVCDENLSLSLQIGAVANLVGHQRAVIYVLLSMSVGNKWIRARWYLERGLLLSHNNKNIDNDKNNNNNNMNNMNNNNNHNN